MKPKRIKYFLCALMMILVCAIPTFATPYGTEELTNNYIPGECKHNYHGEDFDCTNNFSDSRTYTSHEEEPISDEEVENLIAEYKNLIVKYNGIPSDEELKNYIAKVYEIPVEDVDIASICNSTLL